MKNRSMIFVVAMVGMWLSFSLLLFGEAQDFRNADVKEAIEQRDRQQVDRVFHEIKQIEEKLASTSKEAKLERLSIELESTKILAQTLKEDWYEHIESLRESCHFRVHAYLGLEGKRAQKAYDRCLTEIEAYYGEEDRLDFAILAELYTFEKNLEQGKRDGWDVSDIHGDLAWSLDDIQKEMRRYQRKIDEGYK